MVAVALFAAALAASAVGIGARQTFLPVGLPPSAHLLLGDTAPRSRRGRAAGCISRTSGAVLSNFLATTKARSMLSDTQRGAVGGGDQKYNGVLRRPPVSDEADGILVAAVSSNNDGGSGSVEQEVTTEDERAIGKSKVVDSWTCTDSREKSKCPAPTPPHPPRPRVQERL